ncbi:MAG: type II toxin-antitoxin system RelB/DinJ family antitoxin [Desulfovibrio sp.]|jgi:DNA-damage-inducible protein J|nr:type II toxin-antitoxin system RelB/DinJ family antitoxin [Desulfovibrio sp.]
MNTAQTQNSVVRARIDTATKERATDALADMGLSVSDAIRILLIRVAEERRLPFEVKVPNATTRRAIAELEAGGGYTANSVAEMMAALNEDD